MICGIILSIARIKPKPFPDRGLRQILRYCAATLLNIIERPPRVNRSAGWSGPAFVTPWHPATISPRDLFQKV